MRKLKSVRKSIYHS